ncbi:MAG: oligopeptide transporter, OPT family [Coprococcus sp.]|nr:oligopeptide transporter, OPT family [Coprococcus sp.]
MKDSKENFKPFIPADKVVPEFTPTAVILGIILAVVFGAANAYLGLRVGMTVSASIPAAVISMGVIRFILRKDSILENNMVQTIGSAGESLAAGAIFTLPALYMWAQEDSSIKIPSFLTIAILAIAGGIIGVLFMIPLRTALIVEEHGVLPFPEGTACAEVLLAGEEGGSKSKLVFSGLGISAAYKFITDGLYLFPSEINWNISAYKGSAIGMDVLPALVGVGYICGARVSSYMLGGAIIGWFVLMPMIHMLGSLGGADAILFPATKALADMQPSELWSSYIRYIGAGAVACGGILSLIKSLPLIIKTFKKALGGFGRKGGDLRTEKDLPLSWALIGVVVVALILVLVPSVPIGIIAALIIIVFGFFFATVSSRMVGVVGSSNNPVSGMAIATLLIATALLKATGHVGIAGMTSAICIGTVICIIAAMAGDTSQDLKTGYIVGATPYRQQVGELIGAICSGLAIAGVLYLLNSAWGFGSEQLSAPQATLMKMVTEGVMNGNLPWNLVFLGVFIALTVEIIGIPVLPFAIGLYLPIYLSTPIMVGGLIKLWITKRKYKNEEARKDADGKGILFSSGLIAGEGLVGILLAVFAVIGIGDKIDLRNYGINLGQIGSLVFFALLCGTLIFAILKKSNKKEGKQ